MAKIDTQDRKEKHRQPPGTMPKDMLLKHKLLGNSFDDGEPITRRMYRHNRKVKYIFEMVKRYRQTVHGSNQNRLPSSLRLGTHYLLEPMTRWSGRGESQVSYREEAPLGPLTV